MTVELLVNFSEFWSRLREDISCAQQSVFLQTFAFEGDSIGNQLTEALLSSPASDKRILVDSFTRVVLNDRFRYSPTNLFDRDLRHEARETRAMNSRLNSAGVEIKFTNPYAASPRKLLSRNHKKLIVIDQSTAYVGGINFSEHNAAWHDMMLRLTDFKAVAFLRQDFLSTWHGVDGTVREEFDGAELLTLDGRENRRAFQRVLDIIDGARRTIFVESPYITFPFYEHLRAAARRGVDVKIVTPARNNWSYFADYARLESARSTIDLRLYQGGMSHLKAMLIDDEYLIAGSSNFDYLSYRLYQEIIAIFTDAELIADFRERVLLPDLAHSIAVDCRASAIGQRCLGWQTKLIDLAVTALT
ncbi:MAG TPA: phosphatidylserine/phosphatidylglycerophosphate/cardiolipin synthase family protein [Pyrinomonadaceae bacterium]|jgi:cardiolipin synthase